MHSPQQELIQCQTPLMTSSERKVGAWPMAPRVPIFLVADWKFNWRTLYLSGAKRSNIAPPRIYDIPEIDEYFMHTLFVNYTMNDQMDASIAIRNVTDEDVPYGMNSFAAIGAYDILGTCVQGTSRYRF